VRKLAYILTCIAFVFGGIYCTVRGHICKINRLAYNIEGLIYFVKAVSVF